MCETTDQSIAVFVRKICFSYSKSEQILKFIDLTVKKGTIYGLLGSSGCGKTTLLKCILGRNQPKSGEVKVFGYKPDSPQSNIPGAGVGYMPQELALIPEFTTEEILFYFGRIYGMNSIDINDKIEKLLILLDLKNKNKLIGNQSGGQQRRISLACSLIHTPPLLILDEPTVGTDPVLRHNIWVHLLELCEVGQTIILTTHYIEEARNANTVAFMRSGKILAEDEPNLLLNKYESNNLEDVFLKLCHSKTEKSVEDSLEGSDEDSVGKSEEFCYENQTNIQMEEKQIENQNKVNNQVQNINEQKITYTNPQPRRRSRKISEQDVNITIHTNEVRNSRFHQRCSALLHKNYIRITRNLRHLLFELVLTSVLVIIVLVSIGEGPTGINIAVCDEETINNRTERWGEVFVEHLDRKIFNIKFYDTIDEAIDSVLEGQNKAAIEINDRLTKALRLRFLYMSEANEDTIEESSMYVYIDRSNPLIGLQIERHLYMCYMDFVQDLANRTNINSALLKIPLIFEEPLYGSIKSSFRDFATPGIYIALTFYVSTLITGHMVIIERLDGLFERSIVAGITAPEFILSNTIIQIFIVCFQILFLLLLPYIVLGQQITGSVVLFVSLLFLQGFCGVTFGLFVGILFTEIIIAALVLLCWFIVCIATAGVLWPIENMPFILQIFSKLMPNTIAVQSLRDIMYKQWTIDYTEVYMGFVVTFIWMMFFLISALFIFRRSR